MRLATTTLVAALILGLTAVTGWADLAAYDQDFEGLVQADPDALANDGWLIFANVFDGGNGGFLYNYGPFPAPNGGAAFSAIDTGQGGPEQGAQQLSVYNDYNNGDHANGNIIEANVFQEQMVGNPEIGETWVFEFDAKLGNLEGGSTALAFIKTLDPNNGYALTNFVTVDMTAIPTTWATYWISLEIDASLVGQILQFGFLNTATNYEGSGVFYDNVTFESTGPVSIENTTWAEAKALYR
jgi:hypothetical protein